MKEGEGVLCGGERIYFTISSLNAGTARLELLFFILFIFTSGKIPRPGYQP